MMLKTRIAACFVAGCLFASQAMADSLADAFEAYRMGDNSAAFQMLLPLANKDNVGAQAFLGSMYFAGHGTAKNYKESQKWFRRAASHGHALAQFRLGSMYYFGQGVPQDYVTASNWYRRAAEQGHPDAQFRLGLLYEKGEGVEQDKAVAVNWFRKASVGGNARAQYLYGLAFASGEYASQDFVQAHMWLNLSVSGFDDSDGDRRENAIAGRNLVESRMTPEQLAEAQKLAREWASAHSQP